MKRLSYIMLSLLSIIMFGCAETEQPYVGYIVVENPEVPAAGGTTTLTANTDISSPISLEVEDGIDWCTVSCSGKEISITTTPNTNNDSRRATVYVRCGYRDEAFVVTQLYEGHQYEIDWSDWTATGNSVQENDGGGYPSLFTEERTTFWHSNYSEDAVDLPYEITVDMQKEHTCFQFRIGRRAYGAINYPSVKTMEIYTSTDNENFTQASGFTFALPWTAPDGTIVTGNSKLIPGFEDVILATPVKARYVKLVITETNTANKTCQVSYFKAYEKN